MNEAFRRFSGTTARLLGTTWAFLAAVAVVVVWAMAGPASQFSATWQLLINTGTTIVTFLMVFLIQNTQNRDSKTIHLKLDELLHAVEHARERLVDLEDASEAEIDLLDQEFRELRTNSTALGK